MRVIFVFVSLSKLNGTKISYFYPVRKNYFMADRNPTFQYVVFVKEFVRVGTTNLGRYLFLSPSASLFIMQYVFLTVLGNPKPWQILKNCRGYYLVFFYVLK